jgi:hypothetical protein
MTSKRDQTETFSEPEAAPRQPPTKKARTANQPNLNRGGKRQDPKIDQTSGQRYVFGDLDEYTAVKEDGLEFEDDSEALLYLKSVR